MGNPNNYEGGFHFVTYHHRRLSTIDRKMGSFRHYIDYIEKGSVRITFNGGTFEAGAGDFFYLPMGLSCIINWFGSAVVRSCGFRMFPEARSTAFTVQKLPRRFLKEFLDIPLQMQPDSVTIGKFYALLGKMIPSMTVDNALSSDPLLEKIRLFIWQHINCRVDEIASHCGMSKSTLYSTLHQLIGKTPGQLRLDIQIEKSKTYLAETNAPIQFVSDEVHFCNAAYFRKIFKEITGMTPTQYRKSAQQQIVPTFGSSSNS